MLERMLIPHNTLADSFQLFSIFRNRPVDFDFNQRNLPVRNPHLHLSKAILQKEGIFFIIHLFARDVSVLKKLEIEKTQPTFIISVLKVKC